MRSTHSKDAGPYLLDVLDSIEFARITLADMTLEGFENNKGAFYIVTRCLEIISEASRHLPTDLRDRHPDVPWAEIAAAGNIYRHAYKNVQRLRVWNTVHENFAPLESAVRAELATLPPVEE